MWTRGGAEVPWRIALSFAAVAVAGGLLGLRVGKNVEAKQLRRGFAVLLLVLAAFVLAKNGRAAIG